MNLTQEANQIEKTMKKRDGDRARVIDDVQVVGYGNFTQILVVFSSGYFSLGVAKRKPTDHPDDLAAARLAIHRALESDVEFQIL